MIMVIFYHNQKLKQILLPDCTEFILPYFPQKTKPHLELAERRGFGIKDFKNYSTISGFPFIICFLTKLIPTSSPFSLKL